MKSSKEKEIQTKKINKASNAEKKSKTKINAENAKIKVDANNIYNKLMEKYKPYSPQNNRQRKDDEHEKIHHCGIFACSGGTHIPCNTDGSPAYPKNRPRTADCNCRK